MDKNLSDLQKRALENMQMGIWYSAYDLRVTAITMRVLTNKGYVEQSNYVMENFGPAHTSIEWRRIGE